MATDLLEQLVHVEVPPPPPAEDFQRQLHDRVNQSLIVMQLLELVCWSIPWAVGQFLTALLALGAFTISGRFPDDRPEKKPEK